MAQSRLSELKGRRLLLLNWRDLGHPQAGGAELYTEEVGERFAAAGAEVTLMTAAYPDAPTLERLRGMDIVRRGGTFGVYARAAQHMVGNRGQYDAVVDFQNGIPFFAPVFCRRDVAVVCVVHHVHQHQFALHYPKPVAEVGKWLEGPASRRVYGTRPIVAVSASTRADVRRTLGFQGPIHIVPNGVAPRARVDVARAAEPTIACVTRLVTQKRLHLLVEMVPALRAEFPGLTVDLAGDGPERGRLTELVARLGLQDVVRVHGRVSDEVRDELLARSWLTVSPSVAEGWGLSIVEANALGVPAVAFAVPGLRDSIRGGQTGWLVPQGGSLEDGVRAALRELSSTATARLYAERCRTWAARFTWEETTERLAAVLLAEMARRRRGRTRRGDGRDIAARVLLHVDDHAVPHVVEVLSASLRRTDSWSHADGTFRIVLHGVDEQMARSLLLKLGLPEPLSVELARPSELIMPGHG